MQFEAERQQMQNEQATAELQELRAERQQLEHEVTATQETLVRRAQMLVCQQDEISVKDIRITQLTHEIATLKRRRFGRKSEQLSDIQGTLLEEAVDEDIVAFETEFELLVAVPSVARAKRQPKRRPMPERLPRIEFHH